MTFITKPPINSITEPAGNKTGNIILFIGPPGCGKGTQASALKSQGWKHIAPGDLLRDLMKSPEQDSPEIREIARLVNLGEILPAELVYKLIEPSLIEGARQGHNLVLDGFPRTKEQHELLFNSFGEILRAAIFFGIDDQHILERLSNRIYCLGCNNIASTLSDTSTAQQNKFMCQECGSKEFYKRADDNAQTMINRLGKYHSATAPILETYEALNLLTRIDAQLPVKEITKQIKSVINLTINPALNPTLNPTLNPSIEQVS